MSDDPAIELLEKYKEDRKEPKPRKTMPSWLDIVVNEARMHGYAILNCSNVERWIEYRRALRALLRKTKEKDLREEITRELRLTLVVLSAYSATCIDKVRDEHKAVLIEARELLAVYLRGCFSYGPKMRGRCFLGRIKSAFRGAKNPTTILALMRRNT